MDSKRAFLVNTFQILISLPSKRAFDTAQVLYDHQKDPKPSFESSHLRELDYGRVGGKLCLDAPIPGLTWAQHAARGIYLAKYSDDDRFPDGESIKDLAVRARSECP